MARSILDKFKTVVRATLNDLLDRKVNTPEGYRQYIRDLEFARAEVRATADEAAGSANGSRRELSDLNAQIVEKQAGIDLLLSNKDESDDKFAEPMQIELGRLQARAADLQALLTDQEAQAEKLNEAVKQLDDRHQQMVDNYRKLQQTMAVANAKNKAADAVEDAMGAVDSDVSIDDIQSELQHQRDVAEAHFDRVMGEATQNDSSEAALERAQAQEALATRRAQLAAIAAGQSETAQEPTGA